VDLLPRVTQLPLERCNLHLHFAQPRVLSGMLARQLGESRFECVARLLARCPLDGLLRDRQIMGSSRLVTLATRMLEPSLAHPEPGRGLSGARLLLPRPAHGVGELIIQLPDRAFVYRAVRLAILQPLEAARELSLQHFALCIETLAQATLVLRAPHQFGVCLVLRLDGAQRIALACLAVLKATSELRNLARRTLRVGQERTVRCL